MPKAFVENKKEAFFFYRLLALILLAGTAFLAMFLPLEIWKIFSTSEDELWAIVYVFGFLDALAYGCLLYVCRRAYWRAPLGRARAFGARMHAWDLLFIAGSIALLYFVFFQARGIFPSALLEWRVYLSVGGAVALHIVLISLFLIVGKKRKGAER